MEECGWVGDDQDGVGVDGSLCIFKALVFRDVLWRVVGMTCNGRMTFQEDSLT